MCVKAYVRACMSSCLSLCAYGYVHANLWACAHMFVQVFDTICLCVYVQACLRICMWRACVV